MRNLAKILAISLLLGLAFGAQTAFAEEEGPALALSVVDELQLSATEEAAPTEVATRPDPVFLAGSGAGGAGGEAGLVKGESASLPPNYIMYEDHLCCQVGSGCDCMYWPGAFCQPIGCPRDKTPPNC